jgi:hypothetical protein
MDKSTPAGGQQFSPGWVEHYRPQRLKPSTWTAVRPFVVGCAKELGLDRGAAALRTVRVLARLAGWAMSEGLPLDVEIVLDPDAVERFIASGVGHDRSRATYRSELRRLGPLLTRRAPWEPRRQAVSRRQVAAPYTPRELGRLLGCASVQPTPGRVRAARALLALGAGAGLDGRWVARVGAQDVFTAPKVLLVRVGEPGTRAVPVLAGWEAEVLELKATAGDQYLVGGYSTARNRAGALAASIVVPSGCPKFSSSRLRSTWLVAHLAMGTRLPELARAAGLQGVTVLSDLLAFVPVLDQDEAAALLRGSR